MSLLFIKILPENNQLIFGFSRKVAKFQNLLMQPSKPPLKDATDRVYTHFIEFVFKQNKNRKKNQIQVSF